MPKFDSSELGEVDDKVRLTLGAEETLIVESYEVRQSILTQPSTFAVRLGHGDVVRELIRRFPPNTPYELRIGPVLQQTGFTDGYEVDGGEASTITVRGRDTLAPFHDAYADADASFSESTYLALTTKLLEASGIENFGLASSNEANRKAISGTSIKQTGEPPEDGKKEVAKPASTRSALQMKLGERLYEFLKKQLDKAGLFLWAGVDGQFVLSTPNTKQEPVARIVRRRGANDGRNPVNVLSCKHKNETGERYAQYIVYGRAGGGDKLGRTKCRGGFLDKEMTSLGFKKVWSDRDEKVANIVQAQFAARRKAAECRRKGWQLVYTVAGHSTPAIKGGDRCVWAVDTMVEVQDDELDIAGTFYVEGVDFQRSSSGTTSTLTLQRPADLVYGESL